MPVDTPVFTIDLINRYLDRSAFSPIGASLITIALYLRARSNGLKNDSLINHIKAMIQYLKAPENKKLYYFLLFVGVKTINRALNRLSLNHGWASDKPTWSHVKGQGDIVLVVSF